MDYRDINVKTLQLLTTEPFVTLGSLETEQEFNDNLQFVSGEDADGFATYSASKPVSWATFSAKRAEVKSIYDSLQYARDRSLEYPPITDYIDGVVKGDQAQIDAYIAACQAVKAKYPKV